MSIVNNVRILGRPTEKLEIKRSENGKEFMSFTLACNEYYNKEKITNYFKVVVFGNLAHRIFLNTKPNGRLLIDGVLRNNNYKDSNGNNVYGINIIARNVDIIDFQFTPQEIEMPTNEIIDDDAILDIEKEIQQSYEYTENIFDDNLGK